MHLAVMCALMPGKCGDIPQSQDLRYLLARRGLEMHAAQDSLLSILVGFCRVLDCHFPAVFRPAVKLRVTAFDQNVGWIRQRHA
jgi:hypothetical protein